MPIGGSGGGGSGGGARASALEELLDWEAESSSDVVTISGGNGKAEDADWIIRELTEEDDDRWIGFIATFSNSSSSMSKQNMGATVPMPVSKWRAMTATALAANSEGSVSQMSRVNMGSVGIGDGTGWERISIAKLTGNRVGVCSLSEAHCTSLYAYLNGGGGGAVRVDLGNSTTDDLPEGTKKFWSEALANAWLATKDTDDISEGTNKFWSQALFDAALAASTTDDLPEGSRKYFSSLAFANELATKTTDALAEGTANRYATPGFVDEVLLVGANMSKAYDPVAGTVTLEATGGGTGTTSLAGFDTDDLAEGSVNKYAKAVNLNPIIRPGNNVTTELDELNNTLTVNATATGGGITSLNDFDTDDLSQGTTNKYATATSFNDLLLLGAGLRKTLNGQTNTLTLDLIGFGDLTTDNLTEGVNNRYHTPARVLEALTAGTGIEIADDGTISNTLTGGGSGGGGGLETLLDYTATSATFTDVANTAANYVAVNGATLSRDLTEDDDDGIIFAVAALTISGSVTPDITPKPYTGFIPAAMWRSWGNVTVGSAFENVGSLRLNGLPYLSSEEPSLGSSTVYSNVYITTGINRSLLAVMDVSDSLGFGYLRIVLLKPGGTPGPNSITHEMLMNMIIQEENMANDAISTRAVKEEAITEAKLDPLVRAKLNQVDDIVAQASDIDVATAPLEELIWALKEEKFYYVTEELQPAKYPIEITITGQNLTVNPAVIVNGWAREAIAGYSNGSAGQIAIAQGVSGAVPADLDGVFNFYEGATAADIGVATADTQARKIARATFIVLQGDQLQIGRETDTNMSLYSTTGGHHLWIASRTFTAALYQAFGQGEGVGTMKIGVNLYDETGASWVPATQSVRVLREIDSHPAATNLRGDKHDMPKAIAGARFTDGETGDEFEGVAYEASGWRRLKLNQLHEDEEIYGYNGLKPNGLSGNIGNLESLLYDMDNNEFIADGGADTLVNMQWRNPGSRRIHVNPSGDYSAFFVPKPAGGAHPTEDRLVHALVGRVGDDHLKVTPADQNSFVVPALTDTGFNPSNHPTNFRKHTWDDRRLKCAYPYEDHADKDQIIVGQLMRLRWDASRRRLLFSLPQNTAEPDVQPNDAVPNNGWTPEGFRGTGIYEFSYSWTNDDERYVHIAPPNTMRSGNQRWAIVVQGVANGSVDLPPIAAIRNNRDRHAVEYSSPPILGSGHRHHYNFADTSIQNNLQEGGDFWCYVALVRCDDGGQQADINRTWLPVPYTHEFLNGVWIEKPLEKVETYTTGHLSGDAYPVLYYQTDQYSVAQVAKYGANPPVIEGEANSINLKAASIPDAQVGSTAGTPPVPREVCRAEPNYETWLLDTDYAIPVVLFRAGESASVWSDAADVQWELARRGGLNKKVHEVGQSRLTPKHGGEVILLRPSDALLSSVDGGPGPKYPRLFTSSPVLLGDQEEGILLETSTQTDPGAPNLSHQRVLTPWASFGYITQAILDTSDQHLDILFTARERPDAAHLTATLYGLQTGEVLTYTTDAVGVSNETFHEYYWSFPASNNDIIRLFSENTHVYIGEISSSRMGYAVSDFNVWVA